jgi:hypothetical protein
VINLYTDKQKYRAIYDQLYYDYLTRTIGRKGFASLRYIPLDCFMAIMDFLTMCENDWEHGGMLASWYIEMAMFYPDEFEPNLAIVQLALRHDRVEIPFGDKLDDGTCDKVDKKLKEYKFFCKSNEGLPKDMQEMRNALMALFQEDCTPLFAIDKLEFVLCQLIRLRLMREKLSYEDYLKAIPAISDQIYEKGCSKEDSKDEEYAKLIDSYRCVDICYAASLDKTKGIAGRDRLIGVIECAYDDAKICIPESIKHLYYYPRFFNPRLRPGIYFLLKIWHSIRNYFGNRILKGGLIYGS